jgi:hypothetical protein
VAVPTAPAAGEPIAEAWGDVVHDAVVAMDVQAGVGNVNFPNAAVSDQPIIVFPRPFALPPVVVITIGGSSSGANVHIGLRAAPTATQFQVQAREVRESAVNANMPFQWIAYGPRA